MLSFEHIKQRKLVQWALAYLAGAWVVLQVAGELRDTFSWPPIIVQVLTVLLAVGFLAALVLAWYHGEKGQQRVSGPELAIMVGILVLAGVGVAWVDGRSETATQPVTAAVPTAASTAVEQRSIAVLPFVNTSSDPEQSTFPTGSRKSC